MSLEHWLAFVAAASVLLMIPGPTILAVISYSMTHGRRANLPLIAAVMLGDATALAVSLLGLGALLKVSAFWFTVVKIIGGMYLLFLGIKMLRAGVSPTQVFAPKAPASWWRLFANTYMVTALNPKGIVFFVAFLPQFVSSDHPATPQLFLLAATFVTLAMLNTSLYAIFAGSARKLLSSPRAQRGFHLTGGSLLSCAGVWAMLAKRPV
ncbi:LysE family translocator [Pokkaliibacter sp. CJK22405]|uniref:LysE family translocator n=1 Tax=Pokkaliibacter sp. CJK22405 TaxID=3384615 RepID=UPI00398507CE